MRLFLTDLRTLVCVLVSDLPISKLHQCRGGGEETKESVVRGVD